MSSMRIYFLFAAVSVVFGAVSCDEGGSDVSDEAENADGDTGEEPAGILADGETCRMNDECRSNYCESHWTAPADPAAVCAEGPPRGEIRILGNVRDFVTDEVLTGVNVQISGALPTLQDPLGAPALATVTTDENGLFEVAGGEEMTSEPVGLVAHIAEDGYHLSLTGLVEPEIAGTIYPPGAVNHDVWAVPTSQMAVITGVLEENDLEAYAPFGEKGGVIGRVRDEDTGEPPDQPVTLQSRNAGSQAIIRYLNDDQTGFQDRTGATGIYLIFNAALAEKFDAFREGEVVSTHESTVGNSAVAAYVTTIQVDRD